MEAKNDESVTVVVRQEINAWNVNKKAVVIILMSKQQQQMHRKGKNQFHSRKLIITMKVLLGVGKVQNPPIAARRLKVPSLDKKKQSNQTQQLWYHNHSSSSSNRREEQPPWYHHHNRSSSREVPQMQPHCYQK